MNGPIRHLAITVSTIFLLLVATVTYLQVIRGPDYRQDPRNLRVIEGRIGRERGTIITSDGVLVARSIVNSDYPQLFVRQYPEGAAYAQVVGYATLIFGTAGLESSQSTALVSDRDATISGVLNAILGGDIRPLGLRLTINDELQQVALEALGDQRGSVVAIDPASGAILAMVSTPTFDPSILQGAAAGPRGSALIDDPANPILNRSTGQTYPPGGTFEVITTAATLEARQENGEAKYPDRAELDLPVSTATTDTGSEDVCGSRNSVTLARAFVSSCDTAFGALGVEIGADQLIATAEAFGFNQSIPFDLSVVHSVTPEASSLTTDLPGLAQTAIGQRDVRATPLQLALVGAAIANQGEIMKPYLVAEFFRSTGEVEAPKTAAVWRRATTPATAAVLSDLMESAVGSGTGALAQIEGVRVGGKTGTAAVADGGAPDVWFLGFAPIGAASEEPQIAVAVVVEDGGVGGEDGTGGSVAAPIARVVMEAFLDL